MSTEANVGAKVEDKLAALSLDENKTNGDNNTKRKKQRTPRLTEEEHLKQLEEEQAKKEIVRKGVTGTVKWYSVRSRYGFIKPDDQDDDIFVHQFAIAKSRIVKYFFRSLADGEKVVFDIVKGTKGEEAANVTGPDGANVQGVRFFPFYRRRLSTYKKEAGDDEEVEKKPKKRFFRRRGSQRKSQLTDSEDVKTETEKAENEKPKKTEAKKERGVDKSAGDAKEKNGSPKKVKKEARKSVDEKANKEESAKSGDEKKGKKPSPKTEKSKDEVAPGRRHRTNTESESVAKSAAVTPKKEADKKERQKSSVSEAATPRKTSATPKKGETKVDVEAATVEEKKVIVEPVKA